MGNQDHILDFQEPGYQPLSNEVKKIIIFLWVVEFVLYVGRCLHWSEEFQLIRVLFYLFSGGYQVFQLRRFYKPRVIFLQAVSFVAVILLPLSSVVLGLLPIAEDILYVGTALCIILLPINYVVVQKNEDKDAFVRYFQLSFVVRLVLIGAFGLAFSIGINQPYYG